MLFLQSAFKKLYSPLHFQEFILVIEFDEESFSRGLIGTLSCLVFFDILLELFDVLLCDLGDPFQRKLFLLKASKEKIFDFLNC